MKERDKIQYTMRVRKKKNYPDKLTLMIIIIILLRLSIVLRCKFTILYLNIYEYIYHV